MSARSGPSSTAPRLARASENEKYASLLREGVNTHSLRCGRVALQPGESVGEHSTQAIEEAIVVLQGRAKANLGGHKPITATAGQVIYIPPQTVHNIRNAGEGVLRYIYITVPVK